MPVKSHCAMKPFSNTTFMWRTYNLQPPKMINYCSILERKNEFHHLIGTYYSQIDHNKVQCCNIMKYAQQRKQRVAKKDIFVFFLPEIRMNSYLGFKLSIESEQYIQECNNLLIFLRKSENLHMSCNNIFVQCKNDDAWKCFYDLYELFLMSPITTVISMEFYCCLVCDCVVNNEKVLLHFLKMPASSSAVRKLTCDTKKQVKRKSEINNSPELVESLYGKYEKAVHIPKRHCEVTETLVHSSVFNNDSGFRTASGKKIVISDAAMRKVRDQFGLYLSSEKTDSSKIVPVIPWKDKKAISEHSSTLQFSAVDAETLRINNKSAQTEGSGKCQKYDLLERLKVIENISVENYVKSSSCSISCISDTSSKLDCVCKKNKWKKFSNFGHSSITGYTDMVRKGSLYTSMSKSLEPDLFDISLFRQNAYDVKPDSISQELTPDVHTSDNLLFEKSYYLASNDDDVKINDEVDDVSDTKKGCYPLQSLIKNCTENHMPDDSALRQQNIASLSDNKVCETSDVQPVFKDVLDKCSEGSVHLPENDIGACSKVIENKLHISPNYGFLTAAGKAISVSSDAILFAQNIFKEVCSSVTEEPSGLEASKPNAANKGFKRPLPPEFTDAHETVPETFFEEFSFDEKEEHSLCKSEKVQFKPPVKNSGVSVHDTSQHRKRKKSLGGRRR